MRNRSVPIRPSLFRRLAFLFAFLTAPGIVLAATGVPSREPSRNVTLLAHVNDYPPYSACWSYVHPDGREYAILGTLNGTSIVNITDPTAPYEVAFVAGLGSRWREMKQYRTYVYISTEAPGGGVQIVDMTNPEFPTQLYTYTTGFNHVHTLEVDTTRALLYCNGTRQDAVYTGMRILSLADPLHPVEVGSYTADYVHDCFPRGDLLFASCIMSGVMRVLDVSNPGSVAEITSWTYPTARTHSGETSPDGRYLYVCDETNYGTMKIFDIQDVYTHPMLGAITVNPLSIVHNIHVKADTGFVAWYTEGVRLFDLSDPALPAEFGWYDTYGGFSGGFHGVWELAPRFPSGTFIASDIESGLYVFRVEPNYGIVKVKVVGPGDGPLAGVDVLAAGETDSTRTQASGMARLALVPGSHSLFVKKFGYQTAIIDLQLAKGAHDSVLVALAPVPTGGIRGRITRRTDSDPLQSAIVALEGTPLSIQTLADGSYALPHVPAGSYRLTCDRPGYVPGSALLTVQEGVDRTTDLGLREASWYDSCDTDKGWSLFSAGDDAVTGRWQRAVPVGTEGTPAPAARGGASLATKHDEPEEGLETFGPIQPGEDHTPGPGGFCFVTGNGEPGKPPDADDVDGGRTTLTTPALDTSDMDDPTVRFARWWYMNAPGEPDSMLIDISPDGATWVNVRAIRDSDPAWRVETIRVRDYITPSSTVRLRFIAQDLDFGETVEAGVDDFEMYDAASDTTIAVPTPPATAAIVSVPRPNPASKSASITVILANPGEIRVVVYDALGRRVRTLFDGQAGSRSFVWDGRDSMEKTAPSGVYWIRVEAAGKRIERKLVWVR